MRFRKWILFAFIVILNPYTYRSKAQEIQIGQRCPDIILKNIINYSATEARLSDFKGKFLILDFWGTGCASCIRAFPKIDSLQKQFIDKLQFIAINRESYDSTNRFFARMKHIKKPTIPFVTGDTILSKLFPHIFVPHHVWIDSTGIVRFITDGHNATAQHIEAFVNDSSLQLARKKYEERYFFESLISALAEGEHAENLTSYSLLMHCLSGVTFSNSVVSTTGNSSPNRISQTCASIVQLYGIAFCENGKHDFNALNSIILEVKDESKYKQPANNNNLDDWISKYSYNYELMVPPSQSHQLYKKMQSDLLRYFNLKGIIEKRAIKCLSLVRTTQTDKLKTKGGRSATNFWILTNDSLRYMNNQPFERFVTALFNAYKAQSAAVPFIDETNYTGNIDIQISTEAIDFFNIKKLNLELYKYGLALKEKYRLMEVLVLKEAK